MKRTRPESPPAAQPATRPDTPPSATGPTGVAESPTHPLAPLPPVDLFALARSGGSVETEVPVAALQRWPDALAERAGTLQVRWQGSVDGHGRPAGTLDLHGTLMLRCDRCEHPFGWSLDESRVFWLVDDEAELARLPVDDSPEEPLLGSTRFDLASLVEDEVILAVPLSPRHERCPLEAGMPDVAPADAPGAGAGPDHPEAERAGERPRTHRPFAVLADWRKRSRS